MAFQERRPTNSGATATATGVGTLTAFIDQGSEFSGKLSFKDTVRIDGKFEGEIASENTLIVGESGCVHANIRSELVVISGEVKGEVVATLKTQAFSVEEGAQFNGTVEMGGDAAKPNKMDKPGKSDPKAPDAPNA